MKRLLCLASVLTILMPACTQEQPIRIRCELGIAKSPTTAQAPQLEFALENAGREVVQVLKWQTPFEGIRAPMLTITRDGVEVEYRGPMLKRGSPRKDDYVTLRPGERREATIELAEGWELGAPGSYTIEYAAHLFDVIAGSASGPRAIDQFKEVALSCNSVTVTRG